MIYIYFWFYFFFHPSAVQSGERTSETIDNSKKGYTHKRQQNIEWEAKLYLITVQCTLTRSSNTRIFFGERKLWPIVVYFVFFISLVPRWLAGLAMYAWCFEFGSTDREWYLFPLIRSFFFSFFLKCRRKRAHMNMEMTMMMMHKRIFLWPHKH